MAERDADASAECNSDGTSTAAASVTMTADASTAAEAADTTWRSQEIWETSGFLAFLAAHEIKRSDLLGSDDDFDGSTGSSKTVEHRFFRMKQSADGAARNEADIVALVAKSLEKEGIADIKPTPVSWLSSFYALPVATPLARIDLYRSGELFGIDISSGYAVTLLNIQPGEHVLDLCCAPGAKLTMIADLLQMSGSVTGVDFSRQRIGACKQLVHKYKLIQAVATTAKEPASVPVATDGEAKTDKDAVEEQHHGQEHGNAEGVSSVASAITATASWRCRLFHADGRTFNIGPKTECEQLDDMETVLDTQEICARGVHGQQRKRKNKSARARDRKRQKVLIVNEELYDKVLIDAECTHDGSIRHLQKNESLEKWRDYVENHLSASEIERILQLQHDLIRNGFKMLKAGGKMIYSTCSLSVKQNEETVESFLQEEPSATLEKIDCDGIPCEAFTDSQEGRLPGTVRFTPSRNTSGLFIAKIRKASASVDADSGNKSKETRAD